MLTHEAILNRQSELERKLAKTLAKAAYKWDADVARELNERRQSLQACRELAEMVGKNPDLEQYLDSKLAKSNE